MHATARASFEAVRQSVSPQMPAEQAVDLQHHLLEVFVRVSVEAASQIRRGTMSGDGQAVRVAARMLRDAARSTGALVLADVCDRLVSARPDRLISTACQWSDLIDRLVEEVCEDFALADAH